MADRTQRAAEVPDGFSKIWLEAYEAVKRSRRQRELWASRWRPLAWLRCVLFHGNATFEVWEDDRLLRRECNTCSRPVYLAQRECCTPDFPCGPNDPYGVCETCQSYAYPEDIQ